MVWAQIPSSGQTEATEHLRIGFAMDLMSVSDWPTGKKGANFSQLKCRHPRVSIVFGCEIPVGVGFQVCGTLEAT